jgi:hypothetical protein
MGRDNREIRLGLVGGEYGPTSPPLRPAASKDSEANQTRAYHGKRGGLRRRAGPGAVVISSCCRDIKNLLGTAGVVQPGNVHVD